ncbi:MAG TPA: Zn-ribbon domain-containing OB-fold protein [Halobacteriales archaeon]|nr:Zn-ribbon domain-containing OB-fold protein [Halobacteriales archaeon]
MPGFFSALADERLLGAVCDDCGTVLVPPRPACYACGSREVYVEEQPRAGEVVSYTAVHTPPPAFAEDAPYTVAIVELDSEARLTGRVEAPYDDVEIGTPVRLTVREPTEREKEAALSHEEEWPLHVFELR